MRQARLLTDLRDDVRQGDLETGQRPTRSDCGVRVTVRRERGAVSELPLKAQVSSGFLDASPQGARRRQRCDHQLGHGRPRPVRLVGPEMAVDREGDCCRGVPHRTFYGHHVAAGGDKARDVEVPASGAA